MKTMLIFALLLVVSGNAGAGTTRFGDWFVVRSDNGDQVAGTVKDGGTKLLGYRCYKSLNKCTHILDLDISCENGRRYPVLVNSDYHSLSMPAVCYNENGRSELLLPKFDSIHTILQKARVVGFAVPMNSGLFKVVRFSLDGSSEAMRDAEEVIGDSSTYK